MGDSRRERASNAQAALVNLSAALRITLCSGGVRTPERLAALQTAMAETFAGCRRVLFVPWALRDGDAYLRAVIERGFAGGVELHGIHRASDPVRAVEEADGIYVGGGNSFRLLATVQRHGLLEPIRRRVLMGMPYLGISAGTNLACPTIRTTNDMPIVEPPDGFEALGLVPFQINPHYYSGAVQIEDGCGGWMPHYGETRDQRISEFLEENEGPVLGMPEGAILSVREGLVKLVFESARWLHSSTEVADFIAPCELPLLFGTPTHKIS